AVNVYWEKPGKPSTTASLENPAPAQPDKAAEPETRRATEVAPPPAKPADDDPGRPRLQRGRPADPDRERSAAPPKSSDPVPVAVAGAATATVTEPPAGGGTPSVIRRDEDDGPPRRQAADPLIRRTIDAAFDFTETLPDYVCQEMMARFQSISK